MKDNIPPEEKLLRLIRGQKKTATSDALAEKPRQQANSQRKPFDFSFSRVSILRIFSAAKINKILMFVLILSLLFLLVSLLYPPLALKKISLPVLRSEELAVYRQEPPASKESLQHYLTALTSRQIFAVSSGQSSSRADRAGSLNPDLTKDLNIVGIITGDNPQAIIEDKRTQKTYYLSKGQSISDMKVVDISEGKVILECRGERFELQL